MSGSSGTSDTVMLGAVDVALAAAMASVSQNRNVTAYHPRLVQASIEKFVGYNRKIKDLDDVDSQPDSEMDSEMYSGIYSEMYGDSEIDSDYLYYNDFDPFASAETTTFWEQEGMMLRHRESSYLRGNCLSPYARRNQYGRANYDAYNPADLKLFVNNRSLPDPYPKGVTLKYQYLRILNKADRDWRFRFMDLPPEMRLMVYRHLLLFPQSVTARWNYVGRAYPSILGTCSEVYDEAHPVLYEENTFTAAFSASGGHNGDGKALTASVHSKTVHAYCAHAVFLRVPKGIDDYPEFLRRIARLEVRLSFTIIESDSLALSDRSTWPLNHYLYTLSSFLMDGHQLKKLHLKLDISSCVDDAKYGMMLYPLRRLRNIQKVTIEGHIPDNIRAKLIAEMESNEPAFNTMRHWKLIREEAEAQLAIHEAMHGELMCTCGDCPSPDCLEEISFRLFHLADMSKDSGFSSHHEEQFMAHLASLRTFLKKAKVQDLEKLVENLLAKRAAQKEYDSVSDDGRLDEAAKIWAGKVHDHSVKYDPEEDWGEDDNQSTLEGVAENAEIATTSRNHSPEL